MTASYLTHNSSKTEFPFISLKKQLANVHSSSPNIGIDPWPHTDTFITLAKGKGKKYWPYRYGNSRAVWDNTALYTCYPT